MITDVKLDETIEVSKKKYDKIVGHLKGFVAHREENGRYFVKVWFSRVKPAFLKLVNEEE